MEKEPRDTIFTRARRLQVLKWARFVFRIIIFFGSTSGRMLIGSRPDDSSLLSHALFNSGFDYRPSLFSIE